MFAFEHMPAAPLPDAASPALPRDKWEPRSQPLEYAARVVGVDTDTSGAWRSKYGSKGKSQPTLHKGRAGS